MNIILVINVILWLFIWYILLKSKDVHIANKKITIIITILLAFEYISINLLKYSHISFVGLFTFVIMTFLINYFWYLLYKSKKIIKHENITLDYEPIIWPLFIIFLI